MFSLLTMLFMSIGKVHVEKKCTRSSAEKTAVTWLFPQLEAYYVENSSPSTTWFITFICDFTHAKPLKMYGISSKADTDPSERYVQTNVVDLLTNRKDLSPCQNDELQRFIDANLHLMGWKKLADGHSECRKSKPEYHGGTYDIGRKRNGLFDGKESFPTSGDSDRGYGSGKNEFSGRDFLTKSPRSADGLGLARYTPGDEACRVGTRSNSTGSNPRSVSWKDECKARSESPKKHVENIGGNADDRQTIGDGDMLTCRSLKWKIGQRVYTPFDPVPQMRSTSTPPPDYLYYVEGEYGHSGDSGPPQLTIEARKIPGASGEKVTLDKGETFEGVAHGQDGERIYGKGGGPQCGKYSPGSVHPEPGKYSSEYVHPEPGKYSPRPRVDSRLERSSSPDGYDNHPGSRPESTDSAHGTVSRSGTFGRTRDRYTPGSVPSLEKDVHWKIGPHFYQTALTENDLDNPMSKPDGDESFIINPRAMMKQYANEKVLKKTMTESTYSRWTKKGDETNAREKSPPPFEGSFSPYPPYKGVGDFDPFKYVRQIRNDGLTSRQKAANTRNSPINEKWEQIPESMKELKKSLHAKSTHPKSKEVDFLTSCMLHDIYTGKDAAREIWEC